MDYGEQRNGNGNGKDIEIRAILFILSFKLKGRGGYLVFSWRVLTWLFN